MGCQFNIPIFAMILTATLVSTASSMGGGLILYFQGLESLEDSMSDTSAGELRSLRETIQNKLTNVEAGIDSLRRFVFSIERLKPGSLSYEWADAVRAYSYAQVAGSNGALYAIGMFVPPVDWTVNNGVAMLSYEESPGKTRTGTGAMIHGEFHEQLPKNQTILTPDGKLANVLAPMSALDPKTGYKIAHLYNAPVGWLFNMPDPRLPRDDPSQFDHRGPRDYTDPPAANSVMSYWTHPSQWVSSQGVRYWVTYLRAIYMPPPFPHPLHRFKTVCLTLGIDFTTFQPPFDDYKQAHPDTVVLMADRQTGIVQASTILPMVPDWCQVGGGIGDYIPQGCALRLTNLSQAVQSGFRKSGEEPFGSFIKAELDGEDYFIRRVDLGFQNLELVWMRPTSSVQGKVQEALMLLILFTALVLCFDVTIMVMEVIFIAMPMRQLSSAIMSVGDMETEAARGAVERYETRCAMLSEMRALTAGMMKTVLRLEQFRTFIPDALVGVVDDDTEFSAVITLHSPSPTTSDSASKVSRSSHSTQQQAAAARQSLDLHIHSRDVGLLYVNAVNWWQESCAQDDKGRQLLDRHTSLATAVLGVVSSHNGTLDSFSGDRFLVGWNTAKAKGDYAVCAADTAWALRSAVKGVRLSCAVVCGRAWVGNTGTQTVRRFSVMTPLVPWVMKLEAFAKWRNYTCVTDDATALRLEHSYACQVVDALVCRRRKAAIPVLHLLGQIDMATAEWMYQLEESEKKNKKTTQLNGIACAIMNSQWDTARELAGNGNVVDDLPEPLAQSLNHEVFTPLQMCFERNPNDPSLRDLVIGTSKPVR